MDPKEDDGVARQRIIIACPVDGCDTITVPQYLYLTSQKNFVVQGYCPECGKPIAYEFKISELFRMCPKPEPAQPVTIPEPEDRLTDEDKEFLAALNITEPPQQDNHAS